MPIDFEDLRSKSAKGFQPTARTYSPPEPIGDMSPNQTLNGSSLVKRVQNQSQITNYNFNAEDHQQRKEALDKDVKQRSGQLNNAVVAYAQTRIAQVLADIDIAAASIRANAFDQMGMGDPGESNPAMTLGLVERSRGHCSNDNSCRVDNVRT